MTTMRILAVALIALASLGGQQGPPPTQTTALPTLADAQGRLQAQDPAGAAKILDQILSADPKNARAWRMLGTAQHRATNYDQAIAAYLKSLEVEPDHPVALYNIGAAWARKGDAARAFEWLGRARATRRLDMTQIDNDADLTSLKGDPRFAALRPTREDFANPFVEPVKIIHEWIGEAANDQFGWIARAIGDVDGDNVNDLVTSAPTKVLDGRPAGRVYVFSGKTGAKLWTVDGKAGDQLGIGLEAAGDTNADGIPDVVAGAPGGGYVAIYSGRDGRVLLTLKAEAATDLFGRHVSTASDVNADGHADVFVGAPGNGAAGARAGRAYVYSGKDGRLLLTLTGEREGDGFGSTVASRSSLPRVSSQKPKYANDVLLVVGASSAGPNRRGRAYIYANLSGKPQFTVDADATGAALAAMFVSVPGDVDADGHLDVYLSDFANAAKGPSTGRVYVHSSRDGRRLLTLTGETGGEGFGTSPAVAGDVDGDGRDDLVVGAWQYAGIAIAGGRAYLHSGTDGRLLRTFTSRIPGEALGFDAVGIGDVDEDGTIDLLLTSAWSGISGFHSGRMFIVSSGVSRRTTR